MGYSLENGVVKFLARHAPCDKYNYNQSQYILVVVKKATSVFNFLYNSQVFNIIKELKFQHWVILLNGEVVC